jgi:glycosyltransferase involved in cell wall biosynthesis
MVQFPAIAANSIAENSTLATGQREAVTDPEPRLRICVLAACPFPANHGTPGSIRELVAATAERGHEVHVVTYHLGEDLPVGQAQLHRIGNWTGEQRIIVGPAIYRPLYDLQMVFTAIKVILRHKLDLIHAHGYESALVAACCRPIVRRPVLYSAHNRMGDELASYDFFPSRRLANGLAYLLDQFVPRIGNRCIPHSVNLQQFLLSLGLASRTEPVLNFGIDIQQQPVFNRDQFRRKLGLRDDPIVLYTGVLDQFQRIDLLLGAMVNVLRRWPRAKLLLLTNVPSAKHQQALFNEATRLGIAHAVVLTNPSSLEKTRRLIAICDVAVVPRPCAPGFPIKLLNYMAARRPCVLFASSASGISHGEHAWLCGEDSSQSLAKGIIHVLSNRSLATRLAAGGHRLVCERHDRRKVAGQLCQAYVRLLKGTKRWRQVAQRAPVAPELGAIVHTDATKTQENGCLEEAVHASA